ncbi:MAG: glycogen/starch/alpha-glucan phosphorylase [Oscillospiraceae bacterium]|jgi:starch phosphorylase|nr:glycogen/starch/alpha-glucan phosphorylase [Oscillospiraceae bacterium]
MPSHTFDKDSIKNAIIGKLQRYDGRALEEATREQIYKAVASTVRDQIMQKWMFEKEARRAHNTKRLYYLSIEFLMGRSLHNNMLNLCATQDYRAAFAELGLRMEDILAQEPEPALGNGGLGRLAACFLDSLATLDLPAMGCSIRYEYGLFRQRIVDGQQVELPDSWLEHGNAWEIPMPEDAVEVHFGGTLQEEWSDDGVLRVAVNSPKTVIAVPYDMPVVGYDSQVVDVLRLWSARSPQRIDLASFGRGDYAQAMEERELAEVISKVLYPEDNHYEGKMLRLKQHYFFTSASLQYAIKDFKRQNGNDMSRLPEKVAIHINDTHPGMAVPELMRILVDEERLTWEQAEDITRRTIAYTNHTIMSEALEKWPENMVKEVLPRIYSILAELNRRLCAELFARFPGEWGRIANMAILAYGQVHMANLCVAMSHSVNGVSQLHGEILRRDTFGDFAALYPDRFSAITNGITQRRWLMLCNPGLSALLDESIGPAWRKDPTLLRDLMVLRDDAAFRDAFTRVKQQNKRRFAEWLQQKQGVLVRPDTLFDVQAKRLHEYKRQLLNALHILVLYNRIVDEPGFTMTPRTFIFGAKASPGYVRAKQIIRFINTLGALIANHPRAKEMMQVVFLENYDVSAAEMLMPATEVSEQLSTASKEASGTGNMKFMMNGAVTIGTMDGANVEMYDQVGGDNIYIFGMRAHEVQALYAAGTYSSARIFENNQAIRRALTMMIDGSLTPDNPKVFQDLYHALLFGDNGQMADPYFVLKDFGSYSMAQRRLEDDYNQREKWVRMAVTNTACSGVFSSDRTIAEYNEKIWRLEKLVK